ncbi:MAG: penicillin-binding transpeptidase domain-containing protein [Longimicrobiales bacterium]
MKGRWGRFRGRGGSAIPKDLRRKLLLGGILAFALLVSLRSFQVSVLQHGKWLAKAAAQHADRMELPAPRGTIYDRDGVPLAASRQVYSIAIAPREVTDANALIQKLNKHAGFTRAEARAAVKRNVKWRVLSGRYDAEVREALGSVTGVYLQQVIQRFYPHAPLAEEVLGTVNAVGQALGGIELEFDSLLSGTPGLAVVRHGPNGRPIPGMMLRVSDPVPGRDVFLAIDYELQAIADDALRDALTVTKAAGGELLLLDPRTGEVLAAVSRRGGRPARNWSAVTAPYEPGSTIKPFTVAAVLAEGRASLSDRIYGEEGRYALNGRVLSDVHPYGWLTLADGLRHSSNVVIAKAASRMDPGEQYRHLREFGFGSPTGVPYPSESGGLLRRPSGWTRQSAASLAIGYEVSVTPLQLALAYAALANGGILMEPRLVREVRARNGSIEATYPPRRVRRVVSAEVAESIRDVLVGAVEVGTGQAAAMGPFKVAGKTGTVRVASRGRYVQGAYRSTFAGFFPAVDPQLVFLVKLDEPRGAYYGGLTAAPVTRATLEAALAARSTPLDRRAVAREPSVLPVSIGAEPEPRQPAPSPTPVPVESREKAESSPFTFASAPAAKSVDGAARIVPDVRGVAARDAVRSLHEAGLRPRMIGSGRIRETLPAPGSVAKAGALVRVYGSVQER